jgi:hypothetical protein
MATRSDNAFNTRLQTRRLKGAEALTLEEAPM